MRLSLIKTPMALFSLALALPAVAWASTSERSPHIEYDEGIFVGSTFKLSTADQFQDVMFVQKLMEVLSEERRSQELRTLEKIPAERLKLLANKDDIGFWDHPIKMVTDYPINKVSKNQLIIFTLTQLLRQGFIKELVEKGPKSLSESQKKLLSQIAPDYLGRFTSAHYNAGDYRRHHRFNVSSRPHAQTVNEIWAYNYKALGIIPGADLNPGKPFKDVRTFWNNKSKGAKPPKVVTHDQGLFYKWPEVKHVNYHTYFLFFEQQTNGSLLPWNLNYFTRDFSGRHMEVYYVRRDRFNTTEVITQDPGLYRSAINDGPGYRRWDRFNVPSSQDTALRTDGTKKPDFVAEIPGTKWRYKDHEAEFAEFKVLEPVHPYGECILPWEQRISPDLRLADPGKFAPAGTGGSYSSRSTKFNVRDVMTEDPGLRVWPASAASYGQNIRQRDSFKIKEAGVTRKKDLVPGADCRKITAKISPPKEEVPDFQLKPVMYQECGIKPGQVGLSQENRYVIGLDKKKIFLSPE